MGMHTNQNFSFIYLFFYLSFFSFSYLFAAAVDLLPVKEFTRKHHQDRKFLPQSSQV